MKKIVRVNFPHTHHINTQTECDGTTQQRWTIKRYIRAGIEHVHMENAILKFIL